MHNPIKSWRLRRRPRRSPRRCSRPAAAEPATSPAAAASPTADTTLTLVAYAVPEPGWSKIIPAFTATEEGKGVAGHHVLRRVGRSVPRRRRRQARRHRQLLGRARRHPAGQGRTRSPRTGTPTPPRASRSGRWCRWWSARATRRTSRTGTTCCSPGSRSISPSPLSSGSAKWNLLAPYAAKSNGGKDPQAGLDFVNKLVSEHIKTAPRFGP